MLRALNASTNPYKAPASAYLRALRVYAFSAILSSSLGRFYSSSAGGFHYYPASCAAILCFSSSYLF